MQKIVDTPFKESLGIEEEVVIERPQRMKINKSQTGNGPRIVVCRILSYKNKGTILGMPKKLKGKNILIKEGFCQATLDYRKELWKEVKRLREEVKIAYF